MITPQTGSFARKIFLHKPKALFVGSLALYLKRTITPKILMIMKKAVSIFAVVLMTVGLFSNTDNTSNDNTDLVVVQDTQACDQCDSPTDKRGTE
ncbi:hypothetical protein [Maribacter halichondriae]|uniref:hypothetical protein n=1 Tax=Maribacter halichondriae TaxID=2980554 RepID=UPI002359F137|nr:hypothetical protein [Maribacter sp. Hal144]